MGLNIGTALEIFTNPEDLEFTIGQEKEGEKFAIGIFRGPGHRYKPLLTTKPFLETREDAFNAIEETLQTVLEVATRELNDPESLVSQFLNPDGEALDQSKILNKDLIIRILEELRTHGKASTCAMFVAAE